MSKNYSIPIDSKMGGIFPIYNEVNHGNVGDPHSQYVKKGYFINAESDEISAKAYKLFDVIFRSVSSSKQFIITVMSKCTDSDKLKWGKFLINMAVEDPITNYHGSVTLIEGENIINNLEVTVNSVEEQTLMSCYFINDEEIYRYSFSWSINFEGGTDDRYEDVEVDISESNAFVLAEQLPDSKLSKRELN